MPDGSSRDWTLVTVTFNCARQLSEYWDGADIGDARWIVVDNASTDDSVEVARGLGAEVVRLPRNAGFAAANNVGLASVTSRWVGFVNPDVTIPTPHGLERLAALAGVNDALVAPQLVNPDGSEQPNARGLPYLPDKIAHRLGRFPGSRLDEYVRTGLSSPTFCAWVMGAAVGGATELFRALGGWDERYFLYYEDHALGLKAWEAGHGVIVEPAVRWVHEWQRETTRLRVASWRHEWSSGRSFYRTHPQLIRRSAKWAAVRGEPNERVWSSALEPQVVGERPGAPDDQLPSRWLRDVRNPKCV